MGFTSVVIFFVLIVLVFGLLKLFGRFPHHRRSKIILGSYFGVLLVSYAVFLMIPDRGFLELGNVNQDDLRKAEQAAQVLYDAAREGSMDQVQGLSINGKWSFEFNENNLEVVNSGGEHLNILIAAERKDINDGKIEMVSYTTMNILAGLDFTDKINAPQVELVGNKLKITEPDRYEVDLYSYQDFTNAQFLGKREFRNDDGLQHVIGHRLLYLFIPKQVNINDTGLGTDILVKNKAL